MIDPSNLPEGTPVWVSSLVIVTLAVGLFSEKAAQIKGPLGAAARWWDRRQQDELDRIQSTDDRIEAAAVRRYGSRMSELENTVARLQADLKAERAARRDDRTTMMREHAAELERVRLDRDLFAAWAEHLLAWLRAQSQWLAANGVQLPPPPQPTFLAFRKEWLESRQ